MNNVEAYSGAELANSVNSEQLGRISLHIGVAAGSGATEVVTTDHHTVGGLRDRLDRGNTQRPYQSAMPIGDHPYISYNPYFNVPPSTAKMVGWDK